MYKVILDMLIALARNRVTKFGKDLLSKGARSRHSPTLEQEMREQMDFSFNKAKFTIDSHLASSSRDDLSRRDTSPTFSLIEKALMALTAYVISKDVYAHSSGDSHVYEDREVMTSFLAFTKGAPSIANEAETYSQLVGFAAHLIESLDLSGARAYIEKRSISDFDPEATIHALLELTASVERGANVETGVLADAMEEVYGFDLAAVVVMLKTLLLSTLQLKEQFPKSVRTTDDFWSILNGKLWQNQNGGLVVDMLATSGKYVHVLPLSLIAPLPPYSESRVVPRKTPPVSSSIPVPRN